MADREDIDALLIGALYGELDETDRARLDAHLASHPQDRHSLEAMKSTRGLLRDADVASAMVEPPSAVSARLLQEAARRAPSARTAGAGGGLLGFLASFLRPVMAHPALAAAATLVLVAGTAGALYLHGDLRSTRTQAPSLVAAGSAGADLPAAPSTPGPIAFERSPADTAESRTAEQGNVDQLRAAAQHSGSRGLDSYRVSLDDGKQELAKRENVAAATRNEGKELAAGEKQALKGDADRTGYLEVGGDGAPAVRALRDDMVAGDEVADGRVPAANRAGLIAPQVAQGPGAAPPPPPMATSPDNKLAFGAGSGAAGAGAGSGSATGAAFSSQLAVAADKSATTNGLGGTGSATTLAPAADPTVVAPYNARTDAATLAWARDQHARMVKLTAAGNCNEAGKLGAEIQRRAPDYYADRVFNDRNIRGCRAYVEKSRRAIEPSRARNLPSPAAADEAPAAEKSVN